MPLHRVAAWARHHATATDRHGVHSPFVFRLVNEVLRPTAPPAGTTDIEALRAALLRDGRHIEVTDRGAGSRRMHGAQRRVRDIAAHALCTPRAAARLHRLARFVNATNVLEMGTSLGITALYLARAVPHGRVVTMEGCPATLAIAREQFAAAGQHHIEAVAGDFRDTLPGVLDSMPAPDLAFIDGHHAEDPTLRYYAQCMAHARPGAVIVLDDIHWSPGMERAWRMIVGDPQATVTIDLHRMGLVFPYREQAKEHFRLRY
ncbi:MAG: class I SAM-dependent methyltransferase [Flavobacteriales bacterium]|jgi:predicted O-methyltransferase YrrM|nr:class I SAM-dependent methyltransferase [Flavobacteriales bacterium]